MMNNPYQTPDEDTFTYNATKTLMTALPIQHDQYAPQATSAEQAQIIVRDVSYILDYNNIVIVTFPTIMIFSPLFIETLNQIDVRPGQLVICELDNIPLAVMFKKHTSFMIRTRATN